MPKPYNIGSMNNTLSIIPVRADSVIRRFVGKYHCHDHMAIWYVLRGEMKHTIDGKTYIQTPGTFSLVLPYTTHLTDTSDSEDTPVVFSADFHGKALISRGYDCFLSHKKIAAFEGRTLPVFRTLTGERRNNADRLARAILDEDFKKYPESLDVRCRLLADFLRNINSDMPKTKISRALIERTDAINAAADYIADHYREKISLDELAKNAIMSKRSFTKNFKAVTGMTTGELILLHRLSHAHQLLAFSDKILDEIAKELGFYDKSSFSHAFSDYYGTSPASHREKRRAGAYEFERSEKLKRKRRYETLSYYYSLAHDGEELPKTYVTNMPNLI